MADTTLIYVDAGYVATDYIEEKPAYLGASLQAGTFTATAEAYVDQGGGYVINDYVDNGYVGEIIPAEATLTSQFNLTAEALKIQPGASLEAGAFTLTALNGRIRNSDSAMTAFNSTVYAGTRLRYSNATMSTSFTQTADNQRLRLGSNGIVRWDEIPVTGIQLYDETDITLDVIGTDPAPEFLQDFVFSMWVKSDNTQGGTVLSARGPASNEESVFRFNVQQGSMRVSWDTSAGNSNGWNTQLIMSGVDITEWHHYWVKCRRTVISGPLYRYTVELYVDGSLKDTNLVDISTLNGNVSDADDPITVGAYRYLNTYSEAFRGVLAQAWLSQDAFYGFDTVSDFYDGGWVDLGTDGTKGSTLNMPPDWYEPWDYPYTSRTNNADATNYPTRLLNPAPAIFTLTPIPTVTLALGESTLSTNFTITADNIRVRQVEATVNAEFTLGNLGGKLKGGTATLASEFTILPAPTSELFGEASLEAFANSTLDGFAGRVGDIDMVVSTAMSVTAYDFTKAETAVSSEFTTNIVATALIPIKGEVLTAGEFVILADPDVIRGDTVALTVVSTLTPTALRIFDNSISLSALAFAILAGRIIEFRDENTLTVARETGRLLVDWENRLFNIEVENRINTTIRETRSIIVEPESGILLLDEEQ